MKKHSAKAKVVKQKSLFIAARHALAHVMVFSVISLMGHVATTALGEAVGSVGSSIVVPLGGMFLM